VKYIHQNTTLALEGGRSDDDIARSRLTAKGTFDGFLLASPLKYQAPMFDLSSSI